MVMAMHWHPQRWLDWDEENPVMYENERVPSHPEDAVYKTEGAPDIVHFDLDSTNS